MCIKTKMSVRCFFFTTLAGRVLINFAFFPLVLVYNGVWQTRNGPGLASLFACMHGTGGNGMDGLGRGSFAAVLFFALWSID